MLKSILVATAVLLIGFGSVTAKTQSSEEQILGAIAGYYLGNSIGSGDGRDAARVIGAMIGWRYGNKILGADEQQYYRDFSNYGSREFTNYCRNRVPPRFDMDRDTRRYWINGCVQNLEEKKRQLEYEAYQAGRNLED